MALQKNKTPNLKSIFLSIILLYLCTSVFFTYASENFLSAISYSSVVFAAVILVLPLKKRLIKQDLYLICTVVLWILWFAVCLRGKPLYASYRNMILAIGTTLILCYLINTMYKPNMVFIYVVFTFAMITVFISLGHLSVNEYIVREIASGNTTYKGMGIGGYDFSYCFMLLVPCIFLYVRQGQMIQKIIAIAGLVIAEYFFFQCGLFTTLLLSIMGIIAGLIFEVHNKSSRVILIVVLVVLVFAFFVVEPSDIARYLRNIDTNATVINDKLNDIARVINGDKEAHGTVSGRTDRYELAIKGFVASPIWGWAFDADTSLYSGGHSTLLDYLTMTGSIGIILYIFVLFFLYKSVIKNIKKPASVLCYRIVFSMFLLCSFLKGTSYASIMFTVSGAVPMFIFALENKKSKVEALNESGSN